MTSNIFSSHKNNHRVRIWYRRNYILLLAANLIAFHLSGQQPQFFLDLVKKSPKNSHDSIYYELFKVYRTTNTTKARYYADTTLTLSKIYHHRVLQVKASRAVGYCLQNSSEYSSALALYRQGVTLAKRYNLLSNQIDIYNDIGFLHQQLDVYDSALHYFVLADGLAGKSAPIIQTTIASNIGYVHSYLRNYPEAIRYYKRAIFLKENNGISNLLGLNHLNLARIYNDVDSLSRADAEIAKVEGMCKSGCDSVTLANLNYQKGYFLVKNDDPRKAYDFFENALIISSRIADEQLAANAHYQLASLNANDGLNEKAVEHLLKAKDIAESISHRRLLIDVYYMLSVLYGKLNVSELELKYYKFYSNIENDIFNESVANNVQAIHLAQQKKKHDVILAGKDSDLWKLSNLSVIAIIGFLIALTFSILIIRDLRIKRRMKKNTTSHLLATKDELQLREIFRSNLQLDELTVRVTSFLQGPVATLAGLGNVMKNAITPEEHHECVEKLVQYCQRIEAVLKNMKELVLVKNHYLTPEVVNVHQLSKDIHNNFKRINSFLLLNITVGKNVASDLHTDKFLLTALISNAINYFSYSTENPVIEIYFDQSKGAAITSITIKHHSLNNEPIPDENHINHLTAIVIAGRLKGWATIIRHVEYSSFEIKIPTVLNLETNSMIDIEQTFG